MHNGNKDDSKPPSTKTKKTEQNKIKRPTPFRIWCIRYLINNYQHNHTLFSVKHMANTESQDDRIKTSNFNMGRKSLYKKINLETYKKKKECYCI